MTQTTNQKLREIDTTTWQRMSCMIRRRTDMTPVDKLVYTYMLSQHQHFTALKLDYHENMQDIANETGLSRQAVGLCVNRLEALGLLKIHKKRVYNKERAIISYSYTLIDAYNVFKPQVKKPIVLKVKQSLKFDPDDDLF